MAKQDRHERHLMRQRGAGAGSRIVAPSFGFSFSKGAALQRKPSVKPKTPLKHTPSKRRKSAIYKSPTQRAKSSPRAPQSPTPRRENETPASIKSVKSVGRSPKFTAAKAQTPSKAAIDPRSSPVRQAKFYEHLDEDTTVPARKLSKAKKTTVRRRKKPVTMQGRNQRRKATAFKNSVEPEPEESEQELEDTVEQVTPNTRKRKDASTQHTRESPKRAKTEAANGRDEELPRSITKKASTSQFSTKTAKTTASKVGITTRIKQTLFGGSSDVQPAGPGRQSTSRGSADADAAPTVRRTPTRRSISSIAKVHRTPTREQTAASDELLSLDRSPLPPAVDEAYVEAVAPTRKNPKRTPPKQTAKVGLARRMFRIKDDDDSDGETWFRKKKSKK